jgi:hypothetical protein
MKICPVEASCFHADEQTLNNISSEDLLHCYEEWQQRWYRCIRSQGAYFEGDKL